MSDVKTIDMVRNIIEFHHETLDGRGYRKGLLDEDIPLEAKIISVADIFDALISDRPCKKAWSNREVLALIAEMTGEKLDQDCADALLNNLAEIEQIQKQFKDAGQMYAWTNGASA